MFILLDQIQDGLSHYGIFSADIRGFGFGLPCALLQVAGRGWAIQGVIPREREWDRCLRSFVSSLPREFPRGCRDLHFRCRRGSSLLGRTGPLGFDRSSGSSLLGWRTGGAGNSTRDGEFFPPSTRGVSPFLATDSSRGCLLRPSAPRWDIRRSWRLRGVMGSWRGNPHSARGVRPVGVR